MRNNMYFIFKKDNLHFSGLLLYVFDYYLLKTFDRYATIISGLKFAIY